MRCFSCLLWSAFASTSHKRFLFLCIYCIPALSATWSSLDYSLPKDHVTQTTTPPLSFYISLTHSLSLFFSLSPFFFPLVTHCHSLSHFLHPPWLALFLSFFLFACTSLLSHCQYYLLPDYSLIRFGKPLASPFYPLPLYTAEHTLEIGQKETKKEKRHQALPC